MKSVVVIHKYPKEKILSSEIQPDDSLGVEEVAGIIPLDIFTGQDGWDPADYLIVRAPVYTRDDIELLDNTINLFNITAGTIPAEVYRAQIFEWENPAPVKTTIEQIP